jgi:pimeloyl-ACP methyl ester carboxylesterase
MPVERTSIRLHGRDVSLLRSEGRGAKDLLLLHGVPTGAELWRPVLERLDGIRAVAPDLPGFGLSERPRNPSIRAYHRVIARMMEAEGLRRPVLAGHDLGGLYALTFALAHRESLSGLVLLNTTTYPHPRVALVLLPLLAPGVAEAYAWLAGRARYAPLVRRDLVAMYPRETPPPVRDALVTPYGRTERWLALVGALRGLDPIRVLRWSARMRDLDLPVLILWGQDDPYFPSSVPERLHRDLPHARLRPIPGGGHFLPLSRPDEVTGALTGVLSGSPQP